MRIGTGSWPPGWYQVEGNGFAPGCRLHLHVEPGAASGSGELKLLEPVDRYGRLHSPIVLAHSTDGIWLASDDGQPPSPASASVGLHHIGRAQAMLRMLAGLRAPAGAGRWKLLLDTLLDALAIASSMGVSRAAALIVARHASGLCSDSARIRPHAVASLRPGRWPIAVPLQLQPAKHLEPVDGAVVPSTWEAMGEDPGFLLVDRGMAMPLKAGWYRLRVDVATTSGAIVAPALYPDYGQGYVHDEMIRLPDPDAAGRIDVLVLLKWDVAVLRFDPSIRRACFVVREFGLARLGRVSALVRMLFGLRGADGRRDWSRTMAAATAFARTAAAHGMSTAAADLFSEQPYRSQQQAGSYADWVRRYDTIGRLELEAMRRRALDIGGGPLISLLLPVYETPEVWLRRCLDSVLAQVYRHWELCIADDASPDPRVREILEEYARRDARIKLVFRTSNGHIAEASNSALALAQGAFVGLLDHDDELRPHALLEMVEAMRAHPKAALLYSDEDKIDAEGRRFDPYFKPDWNPDLLLSQNYVCHFTVIDTALVRAVGGFRKGFEGSQDHDLFLRCIESLVPTQIRHVPKVLYHWRAIEGSTALARDAKDYAADAGLRAVAEHLVRIGSRVDMRSLPHGHYRVRWLLPELTPRVSIIIPTRDHVVLLRACVESLLEKTDYPDFEILIVDNQSEDPETLAYLASLGKRPGVHVLRYPYPFNYSAINNWAATQATGSLLCLLNNDIEVIASDWLCEMASQASRTEIGAVGAMLYYPDRTIQHAGVILGIGGIAHHAFQHQPMGSPGFCARALVAQNVSAVTGACLVVRRALFEQVGGLDERLTVAFNDIDLCLRIREAGYRNLWTPFAELVHHESLSRGADDTPEKRARFESEVMLMQSRWGEALLADPAYNPNLTLAATDFGYAFPPR
jgi:GT2 family glycosyltransferase